MSDIKTQPYFTCKFKMDGKDYTQEVRKINIHANLGSCFHLFELEVAIDPKEVTTEQLYGQQDCNLDLILMTENESPVETSTFELIPIKITHDIVGKDDEERTDPSTSSSMFIKCVPKEPWVTYVMTTVNKTYDETVKKTPLELIQDLHDEFFKGKQIEIIEDQKNEEPVRQFNFHSAGYLAAIKSLDELYGIYKAKRFSFWHYDDKKLVVSNLKANMEKSKIYTVHFLAQGKEDSQIMEECSSGNENFFTYNKIKELNPGQTDVASGGGFIHKIMKQPFDKLTEFKEIKLDEVVKKFAPASGNKQLIINKLYKDISAIHSRSADSMGMENSSDNDDHMTGKLATSVSRMNMIEFSLSRNIPIVNLTRIARAIEIKPHVEPYMKYQGNYLAASCIFMFTKSGTNQFNCVAKIKANRSNIEN